MKQERLKIDQIERMNREELARRWPEYIESPIPKNASPELLRMALAWQVQARQRATSVASLDRRLRQIAASLADGKTPRVLTAGANAQLGTTIVRTWRGKVYTVTVSKDGFVFDGITYRSLSEIARKITGTQWNGPSFFGLRSEKPKKASGGGRGK